ncbi:putative membrane protein involved in D-alanine export [Rivularia sp. PCC 7116]|uniref:MBOAT family O-acyltransferase n=1 Tax=Rivularia sp. PCC 7116 TaxID=373994 RepID=UPI00029ED7A4|nr:MBOAT family protein [Rivularia sp. PCC 7116]AFY54513.1 putative membrane protein involved in D-alanine export [Rivularia sp. PCC 7116]
MNFISFGYGLFLLCILAIYWSVEQQKLRLWTLFIASLIFYASNQIYYLPLLLTLVFINFRLGLALGQNTSPGKHTLDWRISNEQWQFAQADWNRRRLKVLWLGIILNIVLLFGFKYLPALFNFFNSSSINAGNDDAFKIIAPLGISFFTFECIAYLVDVYRGAPASNQFIEFASYKSFFTKLISGPITRYHNLANQFNTLVFPSPDRIAEGLWLIARGAVKKALLADHLGIFVDLSFSSLQRAGSVDLWLATFAYGLQLYLDFSGYVDIARGSALLFGLVLPENFNHPYFSTSIADFWRRWHMTLGDWLRNYLYFPLGGSRKGLVRTCLNLMTVMVIAGIWHDAALGWVIWGAYHGLALVVHRLTDVISDKFEPLENFWQNPAGIILAWLITQLMVFSSWIWFRLPNVQDSWFVITNLFGRSADAQFAQKVYVEALNISQYQLAALLIAIASIMAISYALNNRLKLNLNWHLKLLFIPLCLWAVWVLAPEGRLPYIYFDF